MDKAITFETRQLAVDALRRSAHTIARCLPETALAHLANAAQKANDARAAYYKALNERNETVECTIIDFVRI